ncbi:MAG: hypothetical protein KFF68_08150, partial [Desulfosarcina sp.]|nr:hypothetical protein [Desulfosarcina sp.]
SIHPMDYDMKTIGADSNQCSQFAVRPGQSYLWTDAPEQYPMAAILPLTAQFTPAACHQDPSC